MNQGLTDDRRFARESAGHRRGITAGGRRAGAISSPPRTTFAGHRYHSYPHDYRPDDPDTDPPPPRPSPPATARNGGPPRAVAEELDRRQRDQIVTDLWNGQTWPPDPDAPPPF
jgi:hypothetical protein